MFMISRAVHFLFFLALFGLADANPMYIDLMYVRPYRCMAVGHIL